MNEIYFYLGITEGVYITQAIYFLSTQQQNRPYRLAYGIETAYVAITMFIDIALAIYFNTFLPTNLMIGIDFIQFPLFAMEVECLTNQDITSLPWSKRAERTGVISMPIIAYVIYCIISGVETISLGSKVFLTLYPIAVFTYLSYRLYSYQRMLKLSKNTKLQDVKWTWCILATLCVEFILYITYTELPIPALYYTLTTGLLLIHGYFIRRQMPADTTQMREEYLTKIKEKVLKEQEKVLEELKDVTETMKKKKDMETAILEYKVRHPMFETKLKSLTSSRITQRDIYISILVCEGMRTPEMAERLGISPASVEVARHRLRNKLNLEKGTNLRALLLEVEKEAIDTQLTQKGL